VTEQSDIDNALALYEHEGLTADMLNQARRVVDRGMANGDITETPELHAFSRWAIRAAAALEDQ
jgi:hypothetical protein